MLTGGHVPSCLPQGRVGTGLVHFTQVWRNGRTIGRQEYSKVCRLVVAGRGQGLPSRRIIRAKRGGATRLGSGPVKVAGRGPLGRGRLDGRQLCGREGGRLASGPTEGRPLVLLPVGLGQARVWSGSTGISGAASSVAAC